MLQMDFIINESNIIPSLHLWLLGDGYVSLKCTIATLAFGGIIQLIINTTSTTNNTAFNFIYNHHHQSARLVHCWT